MFPVSSVSSGMAPLFAAAGVGGAPARDEVPPSSDVDVSSLGQFMGTLALSQKRLGELAAASGARITDADLEQLGTAAGELVEAFNVGRAVDTLAPPSGEALPSSALAGRLAQAFADQRAGLAQLGIDLAPSLLGDDGDMLAVDNRRLLAAFEADRQGTLDTLARAAGSFDEVASALARERDAIGPDGNSLQAPTTANLPPSEVSDAAFRNALRDTAVQPNQQNPADPAEASDDGATGNARQPEAPQIAGSGTPAAMLNNQAAELTAAQANNSASGALGPANAPQQGARPATDVLPSGSPAQVPAQQIAAQQVPAQQVPAQQVPAQQVSTQGPTQFPAQFQNYAQPATTSPVPQRAGDRLPSTAAETAAVQQAVRDTVQPPPTRVTGAPGEAQANPVQTPPAPTTSPDQANAEALARQLAAERFAAERAAVAENAEARRQQVQRDDAARLDRDLATLTQQERAAAGRLALARQTANEALADQQDIVTQDQRLQEVRAAALRQLTTTREEDTAAQQLADRLDEARQEVRQDELTQADRLAQDRLLAARRAAAGQTPGTQEDALVERRLAQVRLAATQQADDARQATALAEAETARQRDALRVLQEQGAERAQAILDRERMALRTQQAAAAAGAGTAAGAAALAGTANEQAVAGAAADARIAASAATTAATAQAAADAAAAAQASLGTPPNPAAGTTAGGTPSATGAPAGTAPGAAGTPGANAAAGGANAGNAPRAPNAADPSTAAAIAAQYLAGGIAGGPNAAAAPPRNEINPAVRPVTRTGTVPPV